MPEKLQLPQLSIAERDRRWKAIRQKMAERNLDCLIIYGNSGKWDSMTANVRYVTHIGGNGEEAIALFPLDGEPSCCIFAKSVMGDWWLRAQSWVSDIREGRYPAWSVGVLNRIKELGLQKSRLGVVGLEGMKEREGIITYVTYTRIKEGLPAASFENATDIIEELRLVKSAEEIAFHEKAAELGDLAIMVMTETARPGVKESEVYANMVRVMLANGAEPPLMFLWEASATPGHAARFPTTSPLRHGDIINIEFSPKYGGYWAHRQQSVALGEPNKEYQEMFKVCLDSWESGMSVLRPGITLDELDQAFTKPIKKAGYTWVSPPFHGLGLDVPEFPYGSIPGVKGVSHPSLVVKEGMVFAVEPVVASPDGRRGIHLGDAVVITKNAAHRLGKSRLEFIII